MLATLAVGCGQPPSESDSQAVVDARRASFRDASPQQYLAAVFARYRNAASYHDLGVVRLDYQVGDRRESKIAPMHVWLDHNQLYVEAYDVRLWSDVNSVTAWISDAASSDFDSQVLRSPAITGRPTLEKLFSDTILSQRIAAGLAGSPPQLEWLFAREPMKQLFHAEHQFEFGHSRLVDGRLCRGVRVNAGRDLYQFWIDESVGVVRRVDLPPVMAPSAPGQPLQLMSLSLVLTDASFDVPEREPDIKSIPVRPKYVRRFVPLPPAEPPRILGSRPPAFRLVDSTGQFTLTDRGADRELTILVRFSGDQQSLDSIRAIERWNASMPDSLRRRIRVAVLVDEQARDLVPRELGLAVVVDRGRLAAQSLDLAPGSLLILDAHALVAWTQGEVPSASAQALVTLGAIVGDILDGVDVPGRIRDQWQEEVAAYRRFLRQESVQRK